MSPDAQHEIRRTRIVMDYDTGSRTLTMSNCNSAWVNTGDIDADLIAVRINGAPEDAEVCVRLYTHRNKYSQADRTHVIPMHYDDVKGLWIAILSKEDMMAIKGSSTDAQICVRVDRRRELSINTMRVRTTQAFVL